MAADYRPPITAGTQAAIDAEASARASADTALAGTVTAEATARANADSAEVTARTNAIAAAIAGPTADIAAETTARIAADTTLTTAVGLKASSAALASETSSRTSADTALDGRLSTVERNSLVPTAVKAANYTAAANDYVPVDTTLGAVTVTLPSAPADGVRVGVKHIIQGSTNAVTIARGGSDVFNKAGGSTSLSLPLLNQSFILQYKASTGVWYAQSGDTPLSALDARFAAFGSGSGGLIYGTGAPSAGTGADGQSYVDTAAGRLYGPKAAGAWPGTYVTLGGGSVTVDVSADVGTFAANKGLVFPGIGGITYRLRVDTDGTPVVDQLAAPFSLDAISVRRWRARDLALANGTAIDSWADRKAGTAATPGAGGTARPTYAVAAVGGKDAIAFNYVLGQWFTLGNLGALFPSAAAVYVVGQYLFYPGFFGYNAVDNTQIASSSAFIRSFRTVRANSIATNVALMGTTPLVGIWVIHSSSSTYRFIWKGKGLNSGDHALATMNVDATAGASYEAGDSHRLGAEGNPTPAPNTGSTLNGYILDALLLNHVPDATEHTNIMQALHDEHGLDAAVLA